MPKQHDVMLTVQTKIFVDGAIDQKRFRHQILNKGKTQIGGRPINAKSSESGSHRDL
jgi:hypothetical protein